GGTFSERVRTAIALHGPYGEGAASAEAFAMLPEADKERVVAFLDSLGRLEFDANGDGHVDQLDLPSFREAFGHPTNPNLPSAVHDIDQNGIVDAVDLGLLAQAYEPWETGNADCNGNGIPDMRDIATGTSADADLDGIPDDCGACRADLDRDGAVDGNDLGILLGAWGTAAPAADLDDNGIVNGDDLGILLGAWGACP
ncbi:MAG: dockerin type I domain-containing protein, partial [Ilumatobacteraceae bacterium]